MKEREKERKSERTNKWMNERMIFWINVFFAHIQAEWIRDREGSRYSVYRSRDCATKIF